MVLPADSHVHSEWSWDTGGPDSDARGRMRATCRHAVRIGLPAIFFTEHLDLPGSWRAEPDDLMPHQRHYLGEDSRVWFAPFDADGYFEAIERMRHEFPQLRIHTGVEFGQPHLWEAEARSLVDFSRIERVLGSLHTLDLHALDPGAPGAGTPGLGSPGSDSTDPGVADAGTRAEPNTLFREHPAEEVMNAYLAEIPVMVAGSRLFDVFTHIDYAIRLWPTDRLGPFDPRPFEEGFRTAMRAIADSGRALEMNTRRLWPWIPQWWAEEGGRAVTFGSDAHTPDAIAGNFPEATAMLEHVGFRPGSVPEDPWIR
ncbi:PHP domain-containing protein [Rathayibacter sp. CAU 1779]